MLRTDFRFPLVRWPQRLAAFLLGEAFLGFLAIIAVGLTLFQMLFPLSAATHDRLDTLQWLIIGWFAVEYIVAFAMAPAKRAFVLNPWRILDVATILIPLAALLPNASDALLSSPVLRLVRLARLVTLGVRVSGVAVRHRATSREVQTTAGSAEVQQITGSGGGSAQPANWPKLLAWLRSPGPEWFHIAGPSPEQLAELGKTASLPAGFLENHLVSASYPHVASARAGSVVFLWFPEMHLDGRVQRVAVLFVFTGKGVWSISRRPVASISGIQPTEESEQNAGTTPFATRVLSAVVQTVIRRNEELVGRFEQELRALEEIPIRESSPGFFERTFRVKKDLSAAQADLWRLKGVVADIAAGRALAPLDEEVTGDFQRLTSDAEYLYETVVNVRDEVLSVLELHLNIVSFDMNRVMRVLAVVSVLGLIPAVIGGLFGMNLIDNPWPFTLPQVGFTVGFGMVLCVYFFFVKGWLR